jgi:hypothetical protein
MKGTNKMAKETTNSLEEYKTSVLKREYRYKIGITAVLTFMVSITVGLILGYFGAIGIITDSQSKAMNVITSVKDTAEVKTQAQ